MKNIGMCLGILLLAMRAEGENYLINGGQESQIRYRLIQHVEPAPQTKSLTLSYVVPENFQSPTYNQHIDKFQLNFSVQPSKRTEETDQRGNPVVKVVWENPTAPVDVSMQFTASNTTVLKTIDSQAPYPLANLPRDVSVYLKTTDQVQAGDSGIQAKALELVQGVKTEFDAVQRILTWVVDHMRYVTPPQQYDALYSFTSGKGNCQNYSHLAAALMRAVGIPARIVNGMTLKQPYTVKTPEGEFTFRLGQGRHSWIEVFFSDLGWIPFDPQQTELFVSNRFIRAEVGLDNEETVNDGLIRWKQARGAEGNPRFEETIEADFPVDRIQLAMEKQSYGPQNMLVCPKVQAAFKAVIVAAPPPPKEVPKDQLDRLQYKKPFLFGNLDFPKNADFLSTRGPAQKGAGDEFKMQKNFLVETAEYVTTKMTQYAQVFVLKRPLKLVKAGLALHKFGGNGQLWIELAKDNGGKPGTVLATSDLLMLDQISSRAGYDWVDFSFSGEAAALSPGKYWILLGFTGSPIVNWFYTYGKPVGPVDGTRYKGVYDEEWSGALAYEFNFRVAGYAAE
jgi:transglutaminase-like putative cysteine protease